MLLLSRAARARVACGALAGVVLVGHKPAAPAVVEPKLIWHVDGEGRGRPAVDSTTAYFLSKRHEVLAIDAASGAVRWRQHTGEAGDATLGSTLLLEGSVVVAGDGDVMAFDRASGQPRWRFSPSDGYSPGVYLGSAAEGLVLTGSPAGRAYALDAATGAVRWSALVAPVTNDPNDPHDPHDPHDPNDPNDPNGWTTVFQPVAAGAVVVAGYTTFAAPSVGGVVAFELATGRQRWRTPFPDAADPSLGTGWAGGLLVVGDLVVATSADGRIHALHREDGSTRWSLPAVSADCAAGLGTTHRDFRPLARTRATLLVGSLTGCVMAFDLRTRRELWRYSSVMEGSVTASLASDEETAYVPYAAGFLLALRVSDGLVRWRIGGGSMGFGWPPALAGRRAYVAASSQGFFAFHR